jgi:hypothetical protein
MLEDAKMKLPEPPGWGNDKITEFIGWTRDNVYATFVNYSREFAHLIEVDSLFREATACASNTTHWFACLFPIKAHSAFLAAVNLIMSTQAQEAFMVMRGALENSLYGYYIYKHPELAEVYLRRDENEQTNREVRKKFQNKTIIELLKTDDKHLVKLLKNCTKE